MGKDSAISWTHHTFNPWWGCEKVSPACAHCYAETWSKRTGFDLLWKGERRFFGDKHWNDPIRWNKAAELAGERRRVFCASMADVFEDREDLNDPLYRLMCLIQRTPDLDWLLLTKRPQNIISRLKRAADTCTVDFGDITDRIYAWIEDTRLFPNIWIGTTVENQEQADKRIPALLSVPARVRFLSCEPLLGPVDLAYTCFNGADSFGQLPGIHWVICGGESGSHARPMHPEWARSIRDQCRRAEVPYHFKQWGGWYPLTRTDGIHELPFGDYDTKSDLHFGFLKWKREYGRLLDGVLHDEFPR